MSLKLNLGCGFVKKAGYINVDVSEYCQPDAKVNLVVDKWPWADKSVSEVTIELALEQMGATPDHLKWFFKELYRVCADKGRIAIRSVHPRHDQFALNPLCRQKISPEFLSQLSVADNLNKIANGAQQDFLGLMWGVNFVLARHKYLLHPKFQQPMESGQITEDQIRERMLHENNICHFIEIDLVAVKDLPGQR